VADQWQIVGQPTRDDPTDVDAHGWRWTIEHAETSEQRRVYVTVTRHVELGGPPESRHALETEGRSEVERVLTEPDPPRSISVSTSGIVDLA
jgi:hypothetical protein